MSNILFRLHCPNCGKNISDTDAFCPHCGINLDAPLERAELEALAQPYLEKAKKALESDGNLKEALSNCNRAIEYIESAEAHNLRGLILDAMGKTAEAILAYQEALRLDPDFTDAKENLAGAEAEYKNNQRQNVDETSKQQKVELTRGKAILLAVFTAWPFLYMIAFMCFLWTIFPNGDDGTFAGNLPPSQFSTVFKIIVPFHLGTILDLFALLVYYIYHLYNTNGVAANKKALWAVILLFGSFLPMPVYWYLYIWKPLKSNLPA